MEQHKQLSIKKMKELYKVDRVVRPALLNKRYDVKVKVKELSKKVPVKIIGNGTQVITFHTYRDMIHKALEDAAFQKSIKIDLEKVEIILGSKTFKDSDGYIDSWVFYTPGGVATLNHVKADVMNIFARNKEPIEFILNVLKKGLKGRNN